MPRSASPRITAPLPLLVGALSGVVCASPALAGAEAITLELDAGLSATTVAMAFDAVSSGELVGDFEPETNPLGTRTFPGLVDGGANLPVASDHIWTGEQTLGQSIDGELTLVINPVTQIATLVGLEFNLVNAGSPVGVEFDASVSHEPFGTVNPNATFPGQAPLRFAVAPGLELFSVLAAQPGPALFSLVSAGGDDYLLSGAVPLLVDVEGAFLGAPFTAAFTTVGLFSGQVTDGESGRELFLGGQASLAFDIAPTDVQFSDAPANLDTVEPPGQVAGVLLSGTLDGLAAAGDLTIILKALDCPSGPDLNCDDVVDGADLGLLLAEWGGDGPADLDDSGVVDGADLGLVLAAWTG